MKEMKYQSQFKSEVLDTGFCFGLLYYIMNLGTHPTAYIRIPNGDMQEEIRKAISKQFAIGIDIGEGVSRSGQSIKNTMMFGG